ncbi:MAG: sugar-binding protein, partial [Verrucomicrobiota bacterium]
PPGEVTDMVLGMTEPPTDSGNMVYEVAIPWSRVSPFQPEPGANLGFTLILNEDDGHNRDSFLTWFGNAHNKDIGLVGDLVLEE